MIIRRRDFLKTSGAIALSATLPRLARAVDTPSIYELERFGNARILHLTDTHAQLRPVYFREPGVNIGIGEMQGRPPHLVGKAFLDRFGIPQDSADAYAFTSVDFEKSAQRFGKLGGFAHLKTLVDRLRGDVGQGRSLLLDGGDLWQGTGLANAMQGADMVEAGWSIVDPVLDVWQALPPRRFPNYPSGTWGPAESDELLARDGRQWRKIEP